MTDAELEDARRVGCERARMLIDPEGGDPERNGFVYPKALEVSPVDLPTLEDMWMERNLKAHGYDVDHSESVPCICFVRFDPKVRSTHVTHKFGADLSDIFPEKD